MTKNKRSNSRSVTCNLWIQMLHIVTSCIASTIICKDSSIVTVVLCFTMIPATVLYRFKALFQFLIPTALFAMTQSEWKGKKAPMGCPNTVTTKSGRFHKIQSFQSYRNLRISKRVPADCCGFCWGNPT